MRNRRIIAFIIWLCVFAAGCAKKPGDPEKIISGEGAKVWKEIKETDTEGKKDRMTREEKQETLQFYSNHTFTAKGATETNEGTWKYSPDQKNLSLQFGNDAFTQNFTVLDLEKDKMTLKAPDGSTLTMKAEKD